MEEFFEVKLPDGKKYPVLRELVDHFEAITGDVSWIVYKNDGGRLLVQESIEILSKM